MTNLLLLGDRIESMLSVAGYHKCDDCGCEDLQEYLNDCGCLKAWTHRDQIALMIVQNAATCGHIVTTDEAIRLLRVACAKIF